MAKQPAKAAIIITCNIFIAPKFYTQTLTAINANLAKYCAFFLYFLSAVSARYIS